MGGDELRAISLLTLFKVKEIEQPEARVTWTFKNLWPLLKVSKLIKNILESILGLNNAKIYCPEYTHNINFPSKKQSFKNLASINEVFFLDKKAT